MVANLRTSVLMNLPLDAVVLHHALPGVHPAGAAEDQ